jgi:hypothetical protein
LKLADLFPPTPDHTHRRTPKTQPTPRSFSTANAAVADLERRLGQSSVQ